MGSEDILIELKDLSSQNNIKKSELMDILKKYARTITVYDLMMLSQRMRKESQYHLSEDYCDEFLKIYIKNFILRITELIDLDDYDDIDMLEVNFPET